MVFKTTGNKSNSVILFFHAMGVTGESSMPVAEKMAEKYYCIMPTSTVYCSGQRYQSKRDEIQQIVRFGEPWNQRNRTYSCIFDWSRSHHGIPDRDKNTGKACFF